MSVHCLRGGNLGLSYFWGVALTGVPASGMARRVPDPGRIRKPDCGLIEMPLLTRNIIRSWFLLFCAKDMQVSFILLVAWIFALYWTNSSAISLLPRAHANINGVLPNLSVYSMSAPSSIKPRTQVNLFFSMANEIGVLPSWSIGSTLAPYPIIIKMH